MMAERPASKHSPFLQNKGNGSRAESHRDAEQQQESVHEDLNKQSFELQVADPVGSGSGLLSGTTATPQEPEQSLQTSGSCFMSLRAHSGILFALVAMTGFAFQGAVIKVISEDINLFQLNAVMMSVIVVGSGCLMIITNEALPRTIRQYLWLLPSGVAVSTVGIFIVLSYRNMLYSDSTSIVQVNIILVGVLSWVIIREPFRIWHFLLALVALVGVICISRPTFIFGKGENQLEGTNNLLGTAFALLCAVGIALSLATVRKQSSIGIHPFQSSFGNAFFTCVVNIILCTAYGKWECPIVKVWLCNFAAGFIYLITQTTLYSALAREKAPIVSIITTLQVVIAFILQFTIFKVIPLWTSWVGSLLIMAACIGTLIMRATDQRKASQ